VKRLALLFVVALASAAVTYFLVGLRQPRDPSRSPGSDVAWICTEFNLAAEPCAAVRKLHDEYSGQCAQHCADIVAARSRLAGLAPEATTDRAAATARIAELEAVCNEATRFHLRRVAAVMPAAEGERFLRLVEPHLAQLPHDGARGFGR
jgi:hypothetical protein